MYSRPLIEDAWERRAALTEAELAELAPHVEAGLDALDRGELRAANPTDGTWAADPFVKKLILLSFPLGTNTLADAGPGRPKSYDKIPLKFEHWQGRTSRRRASGWYRARSSGAAPTSPRAPS